MKLLQKAIGFLWIIPLMMATLAANADDQESISLIVENPNDTVTISLPSSLPNNIAVITPNREFYTLYDPEFYSNPLFENVSKKQKISFNISKLQGQIWIDGKPYIKPIFNTNGTYEFYFADNLETERDNTHWYSLIIQFGIHQKKEMMKPLKHCSQTWPADMVGHVEAKHYICVGIKHFNNAAYKKALEAFEKSNDIALFEAPNSQALPYLAATNWALHRDWQAKNFIDQAYLSLMIDAGAILCDNDEDFALLPNDNTAAFDNAMLSEVAVKMCSPLYNGYYGNNLPTDWSRLKPELAAYSFAAHQIPNSHKFKSQ